MKLQIASLSATMVNLLLMGIMAACSAEEERPWWTTAVMYQIYPRSFMDSNGNGIGDIKGITAKADYLKEIGVTVIWLSPIFTSPMVDFGYDIKNYRVIDPIFGTIEDLKELMEKLKSLDIKFLLDLVPNHTSDQHEWFQKSVQRIDPYTDYYVWNEGKIDPKTQKRVPPNNWVGMFSGSAWEWNDQRKQFYLHFFDKVQVDLNYRNPAVVKEMDDIIKFWLEFGVDGFRVDAVLWIVEDKLLRDEPKAAKLDLIRPYYDLKHIYTENQPETFEMLNHWAEVVYNYSLSDGKSRALFVEAYADQPTVFKYYGRGKHSIMQPFNFKFLETNQSTRAIELKEIILSWVDQIPEGTAVVWVLGNHDRPRVAERYGPEAVDAMDILTGVLPGVRVTYNGEEIGMKNTFLRWDQTIDPEGLQQGPDKYMTRSRDPVRTPMQWDDSVSAGFSSNMTTWLPVNPDYWCLNVKAQSKADTSYLKVYKAISEARKDPVLLKGDLKVLVPDPNTLMVVRSLKKSYYIFIFNMDSEISTYTTQSLFAPQNLDMDVTVVVASINSGIKNGSVFKKGSIRIELRPRAAILLKSN